METLYQWVIRNHPSAGWFVEAGAHDGIGDSATYGLEQIGWDGLCLEPSSAYNGLARSRRCKTDNRALWSSTGEMLEFTEACGNYIELSGVTSHLSRHHALAKYQTKIKTVASVSLADALAFHGAPQIVDFLSLDTEGSELEILQAHDFNRFLFALVSVEHNGIESRRKDMRTLLASKGYRLDVSDAWSIEDWFVYDESKLRYPVTLTMKDNTVDRKM